MAINRTNRDILTGGKKYVQKQQKKFGVEEVVFDKESRQDYLTGFHKRKVQRQKKAQEFNKEQERLMKIEERKKIRDERKQDLDNQLKLFNRIVKDITSDDEQEEEEEEWQGLDDDTNQTSQSTQTYHVEDDLNLPGVIDSETTVIVEPINNPLMNNIQDLSLEAKARANNVDLSRSQEVLEKSIKRAHQYAITVGKANGTKERIKKKKFRYLTKTERKERVHKEKSKKSKAKKSHLK